jgi:hypothetical protein
VRVVILSLSLSLSLFIWKLLENNHPFFFSHSLFEYLTSLGKLPGLPVGADTGFLYAPARMGGLFYGIADFKER